MIKCPVLYGVRKYDAIKILAELNISYRILREDNKIYDAGRSIKENRVNLFIKNGVVDSYGYY
jgi:hypothetical protein